MGGSCAVISSISPPCVEEDHPFLHQSSPVEAGRGITASEMPKAPPSPWDAVIGNEEVDSLACACLSECLQVIIWKHSGSFEG
ncbi:hypothetical protein E2C01_081433 [Portunus trituberculatus]|uniref:Uncharacterized protein n=1 Tax=Portunus trituberculatus TaxID=210409 RepID=A0A5B7IWN2_PORTR|nr:hypothetical protein [Portunus trituberculatus]